MQKKLKNRDPTDLLRRKNARGPDLKKRNKYNLVRDCLFEELERRNVQLTVELVLHIQNLAIYVTMRDEFLESWLNDEKVQSRDFVTVCNKIRDYLNELNLQLEQLQVPDEPEGVTLDDYLEVA